MNKYLKWFLVVVIVLTGYRTVRHLSARSVVVVQPTRGPAIEAVYATGIVEAIMAPIGSRIAARLARLNVDEGAEVSKDQVLAELETDDPKGALSALQANVEILEPR